MLMSTYSRCLKVIVACLLTIASFASHSSTETWQFTQSNGRIIASNGGSISIGSNLGNTLNITGWSTSNEFSNTSILTSLELRLDQFGLQLFKNSTDSHYVDNRDGYDFVLLEFPDPVQLVGLQNAHVHSWSWVSIGAFANAPIITSGVTTLSSLAADAFFKASYKDTGTSLYHFDNKQIQGPAVEGNYSRFWLLGAYIPLFNGGNFGLGDYLKFGSLVTKTQSQTSTPSPVSAPATFALLGLGLLLLRTRRRTH